MYKINFSNNDVCFKGLSIRIAFISTLRHFDKKSTHYVLALKDETTAAAHYVLYTLCVNKVHPFYFCDYSVKRWPISGNIAAEKICKQMTYSLLIISSSCTNITKYQNKYSVCFQCCHFVFHRDSFLQLVQKCVQSPQSSTFIRLLSFLLYNLLQSTNFPSKFIVAATHVYIKPLTPNHRLIPSNARSVSK